MRELPRGQHDQARLRVFANRHRSTKSVEQDGLQPAESYPLVWAQFATYLTANNEGRAGHRTAVVTCPATVGRPAPRLGKHIAKLNDSPSPRYLRAFSRNSEIFCGDYDPVRRFPAGTKVLRSVRLTRVCQPRPEARMAASKS